MIEPATLNVRVTAQGMTARYEYDLRVGSTVGESPPLEMEYTVEVDPELVKGCRARIDAALTKAADAQSVPEPGLVKELARWGKLLYDQLFPRVQGNAAELVTRLHASTGPVLVRTNEQEVPWELLHDGRDFLGLRHDLGRRMVGKRPVVGGRSISRVGRALIVGDTIGDLPSAREEVAKVAAWLGGRGIECKVLLGHEATVLDVVTELASDETPYDLFHFCGHVATGDGTTGLMMHGRQLLGAVALQTLSSCGAPPVAFINGCASAGGGEVASMCMSFMSLGAKTVVGTRTEVADEGAWQFAAEFYGRLLAGEPAGAGVRAARAALRERPDAAWASFILYGDPAVGITKDETTESPQLPEPHDEDMMIALAPDARQLMQRVYESAADRGGVASVDLLQGLLGEEDIRQRIEGSIGADAMEALDQVIDQVLRPPRVRTATPLRTATPVRTATVPVRVRDSAGSSPTPSTACSRKRPPASPPTAGAPSPRPTSPRPSSPWAAASPPGCWNCAGFRSPGCCRTRAPSTRAPSTRAPSIRAPSIRAP